MTCSLPRGSFCSDMGCEMCYNKSVAQNHKAIFMRGNNPRFISKCSNKKYKFYCDKCDHIFEISPYHLDENKWCSFCAGKKLCPDINNCSKFCDLCYNKSCASTYFGEFMIDCDPRTIFKNSNKIKNFWCNNCEHIFPARPSDINKGNWCSYCSEPPQRMCPDTIDCVKCHDKSCASTPSGQFMIECIPRNIFKHSNTKYKYECNFCDHIFEATPNNINSEAQKWCPYCANKKLCPDTVDCEKCYDKSCASTPSAKFMRECIPRNIFKYSNTPYKYFCDKCNNIFETCPNAVNGRGSWCNICRNKTEKKLLDYLSPIFPQIKTQYKPEWCRNIETNQFLPFDFCIESLKIIIELDGPQHFIQVGKWKCPEEQQKRDFYKMNLALNRGYSIIRLLQTEVISNKITSWQKDLHEKIKIYEKPSVFYICNKDEYKEYANIMNIKN